MTASEIRQSFLDFFREQKKHTIVPSASLLPQSPGLLFTNAGMNQFVPYFLGTEKPPFSPPRAADTQKCIRAGGKHNDLEDVGYDSYHHTFFEMLGNWSFGDYFKQETIDWSWELLTRVWGFPPARLYATVYRPGEGDPGVFDAEAHTLWSEKFVAAGLDPAIHVVDGNVKDNFWMMGETGPCGPCSELHIDLTEQGDTQGELVNGDSDRCIEIWNLVFIQYNAEADGSFRELPARHVDTGMGFERVCSVLTSTKNFTDFSGHPSNYATDVFTPIFARLEELCGAKYGDLYPEQGQEIGSFSEELKRDVALRVIADHIRTLSLSIADGILPGNNGRNYVLRRILRRAVRYGRQLGFTGDKPFLPELVDTLVAQLGEVFPELKTRRDAIVETLAREETSFNETLDRGLAKLEEALAPGRVDVPPGSSSPAEGARYAKNRRLPHFERPWGKYLITVATQDRLELPKSARAVVFEAIRHFNHDRYLLHAAVVMPDHVHMLIEPQPKSHDADNQPVFWGLGELMHSIKSFTSKKINALLEREGTVWQRDYHDRLIRSDRDLAEKFDYVISNPQRAGLEDAATYPFVHPAPGPRQDAEAGRQDAGPPRIEGDLAFQLYDTFGFPIDLTQLLARERGLSVDMERFDELMEQQRERARAAGKSTVVKALDFTTEAGTEFVGYDQDECEATVTEVHQQDDLLLVITNRSPFYAEMGGQQGDQGTLVLEDGTTLAVTGVQQVGSALAHLVDPSPLATDHSLPGTIVRLAIDARRRRGLESHHSATHLLHWALHEEVSTDATQQGSLIAPDRLRFDFTSAALSPAQISAVEERVNRAIAEDAAISTTEVRHADIEGRADIQQFFGNKYGEFVRVVQIGGQPGKLNGYSMELCGGTHRRRSGELGVFKIRSEGAIASGVRRLEALVGAAATDWWLEEIEKVAREERELLDKLDSANRELTALDQSPVEAPEFPHIMDALLDQGGTFAEKNATWTRFLDHVEAVRAAVVEAGKALKKASAAGAAREADAILSDLIEAHPGKAIVLSHEGEPALLQELLHGVRKRQFPHAAIFVLDDGNRLHLGIHCGEQAREAGFEAGTLIRELAAIAGGKGGGKADQARGAAPGRARRGEVAEAAAARLA